MAKQVVEVMVDGGKASAGPPLGPALGPMGVNVVKVVQLINEKTKGFDGMKVPVKVIIDVGSKEFEVTVGTPPTSALVLKEVRAEKGSGTPNTMKIGNISIDTAVRVAKMKEDDLSGRTLKHRVKEVIGTCVSMGVTVEGKDGRETQKRVDAGDFDGKLKE